MGKNISVWLEAKNFITEMSEIEKKMKPVGFSFSNEIKITTEKVEVLSMAWFKGENLYSFISVNLEKDEEELIAHLNMVKGLFETKSAEEIAISLYEKKIEELKQVIEKNGK